jgi:hypothetical protein
LEIGLFKAEGFYHTPVFIHHSPCYTVYTYRAVDYGCGKGLTWQTLVDDAHNLYFFQATFIRRALHSLSALCVGVGEEVGGGEEEEEEEQEVHELRDLLELWVA